MWGLHHRIVDVLLLVNPPLFLIPAVNLLQYMTHPLGLFFPINRSRKVVKLVQLLGNVGQKRVCKSGYVRSGDASLTCGLIAVVLHKNVTGKTDSFHAAIYSTGSVVVI